MNEPIRRLSVFVFLLFVSLLVSSTVIQAFESTSINARSDNRRTLLSTYGRERGAIIVGGKAVAVSERTKDQYKYIRTYADGEQYAQVTGYYSFVYGPGDGIESAENSLLSGRSDKLFYRRWSDILSGKPATGASLELTIDPAAQSAARKALGSQRGAAVAVDPRTGAILALVSNPTYDPTVLSSHDLKAVEKAMNALDADPDKPLIDRAIGGDLYAPGSTFKIVTSAAALSSGKYTSESVIPAPVELDLPQTTRTLPNYGGETCSPSGEATITDALAKSCNTSFGWLALQLGESALQDQAEKFGFGDHLTIPMPVTPSVFPTDAQGPLLAYTGIGQYDLKVTPLQVAMISAAVANGGSMMRPYLVQSVLASDLTQIDTTKPEELSRAVSRDVAAQLKDMMIQVVERGTGTAAQISGVTVAGKTGTAEQGNGKAPDAWFTGFAPADNPRIAVAVVVEDGGDLGNEAVGGRVAAPVARAIMKAVLAE